MGDIVELEEARARLLDKILQADKIHNEKARQQIAIKKRLEDRLSTLVHKMAADTISNKRAMQRRKNELSMIEDQLKKLNEEFESKEKALARREDDFRKMRLKAKKRVLEKNINYNIRTFQNI